MAFSPPMLYCPNNFSIRDVAGCHSLSIDLMTPLKLLAVKRPFQTEAHRLVTLTAGCLGYVLYDIPTDSEPSYDIIHLVLCLTKTCSLVKQIVVNVCIHVHFSISPQQLLTTFEHLILKKQINLKS